MEIIRTDLVPTGTFGLPKTGSMTDSLPSVHRPEGRRRILVFDDDPDSCTIVSECLDPNECEIVYCRDVGELNAQVIRSKTQFGLSEFDLVLWGLANPLETGLESLVNLRELAPSLRVVLLAPQEALAHAAAIKAAHVEVLILKPLHVPDVRNGVERALRKPRLIDASRDRSQQATVDSALDHISAIEDGRDLGLIGTSPEIRRTIALIRRIGRSRVNVLITGESGTGKEMVASAIHRVSDRAKKPFIAINCAAIPRELLESELFGHAKGAFTGATTSRRGLFEEAHEGTILLDEIGDLPLSLQAKILRLLQTKQVKPLGQNTMREVDVRIISATHKHLKSLIQKGEFREDLYYRLNVMPIHLPPLRERKDDITLLAEFFLKRFADSGKGAHRTLSRKAIAKLHGLPWRGNVRELENVIERAIVMADSDQITENEILTEEMEPQRVTTEELFNAGMTLRDIEREYIKYVLRRTSNRKEAAIRILGIDRKTLYRKEKIYEIKPPNDMN